MHGNAHTHTHTHTRTHSRCAFVHVCVCVYVCLRAWAGVRGQVGLCVGGWVMMMIAFITFKSSLVPLFEGL